MAALHVVVACLANQCRSPMAEFLLGRKIMVSRAHGQVDVSSAGLQATPGLPATSGARRAVKRRFAEDALARHKASLLTPGMLVESDVVLVMTGDQKAQLIEEWDGVVPGLAEKLFTLGEYAGRPSADVDDPVGMPDARYDACLQLIDELTTAAVKRLTAAVVPATVIPRPRRSPSGPGRRRGRARPASPTRARRRAP